MRHELAMTKNVRRFLSAMTELRTRPVGVEGMGILYGDPGEGKSTVVAYATNVLNGVFVRCNAAWTMTSLLQAITTELTGVPTNRRASMMTWITRKLMEEERVIFVDEADYLFNQTDMLDIMRDIYDLTGTPVVFIGMDQIARRIQDNGRFARRITSWIEFKGVDLDDARTVADTVCEVRIADDLLGHLHREAKANVGRMIVGLSRIEGMGRNSGLEMVSLADWNDRPLYFDQPKFRRGR